MWIENLLIRNYRVFIDEFSINLAQNITCISGHNGTGKSTILAILSNCGELKKKDGKHLNGTAFKGEFSELIKGDKEFDTIGHKATLRLRDLPSSEHSPPLLEEIEFRAAFQGEEDRYRLIPKKIHGVRDSEAKLRWPTYYLGLSRLYPIGESKNINRRAHFSEEIDRMLTTYHADILSMDYGENAASKHIAIAEHSKSKIGIKSEYFSETANSSGQDNLSQIILSVLSFEHLKQTQDDYYGGLLLIDELDATLHPAVQKRLFDFLWEKSVELDLQIVFTTHSINLIDHVSKVRKKENSTNKIKVSFLTKRESEIRERENPPTSLYERDLNDVYTGAPIAHAKVKVITEDKIARWFINGIIGYLGEENNLSALSYLDIDISWSHIIKLIISDIEVFENYLAVLDPDVYSPHDFASLQRQITGYPLKINDANGNIFVLPSLGEANDDGSRDNIEKMMWKYVSSISATHDFYNDPTIEHHNWQKRLVLRDGPLSDEYSDFNESKKYKKWFEVNKFFLDIALRYWVNDNEPEVRRFINVLKGAYNRILSNLNK